MDTAGALSADTVTYNNNPSYSSIGKPHLDYFAGVTRQTKDKQITKLALECLQDNFTLAVLTFFQKRDCRGGAGERKPFILSMVQIPTNLRRELYQFIPEYGYWDDLNKLALNIPEDRDFIAQFWARHLYQNVANLETKFDSNLEKWLPTEGQADDKAWNATDKIIDEFNQLKCNLPLRHPAVDLVMTKVKAEANKINPDAAVNYSQDHLYISCDEDGRMTRKYFHILKKAYVLPERLTSLNHRTYRKWCSFSRAFSGIVEHFKTIGEWDLINYPAVPSIAFDRTKEQFAKHDSERFKAFIEDVKKGKAKINIGRLMPFELLRQKPSEERDEQWRLIVEETRKFYSEMDPSSVFHPANSIHVADVSGSMTFAISPRPIDISLSLAILMAEVGQRPIYTFSGEPKKYNPTWSNLTEAQEMIEDPNYNTDLELLINHIHDDCMEAADKDRCPPSDKIPGSIFIYTDGGFDEMCHMKPITAIDFIQKKFAPYRKVPIIIFWNVSGNTTDFTMTIQHEGCIQLAGFSKDLYSIFIRLTDFKELTPEAFFRKAVLSERYLPIYNFLNEWQERNPRPKLSSPEGSTWSQIWNSLFL